MNICPSLSFSSVTFFLFCLPWWLLWNLRISPSLTSRPYFSSISGFFFLFPPLSLFDQRGYIFGFGVVQNWRSLSNPLPWRFPFSFYSSLFLLYIIPACFSLSVSKSRADACGLILLEVGTHGVVFWFDLIWGSRLFQAVLYTSTSASATGTRYFITIHTYCTWTKKAVPRWRSRIPLPSALANIDWYHKSHLITLLQYFV